MTNTDKVRFIEIPRPLQGNGVRYGAAVGAILRELEDSFYEYDAQHSPHVEIRARLERVACSELSDLQLFKRAFQHSCTRATLMMVNGEPVGVCMTSRWSKDQATFWNFCVSSKYRGKGYGKLLMQHNIDLHSKLGYRSMNLYVHGANTKAYAMYEEFGFKPLQVEMHLTLEKPHVQRDAEAAAR